MALLSAQTIALSAARSHGRISSATPGIVEEECDESLYWIEMLVETNQIKPALVVDLIKEGEEILAIIVASAKTASVKNNPQSAIANPK